MIQIRQPWMELVGTTSLTGAGGEAFMEQTQKQSKGIIWLAVAFRGCFIWESLVGCLYWLLLNLIFLECKCIYRNWLWLRFWFAHIGYTGISGISGNRPPCLLLTNFSLIVFPWGRTLNDFYPFLTLEIWCCRLLSLYTYAGKVILTNF